MRALCTRLLAVLLVSLLIAEQASAGVVLVWNQNPHRITSAFSVLDRQACAVPDLFTWLSHVTEGFSERRLAGHVDRRKVTTLLFALPMVLRAQDESPEVHAVAANPNDPLLHKKSAIHRFQDRLKSMIGKYDRDFRDAQGRQFPGADSIVQHGDTMADEEIEQRLFAARTLVAASDASEAAQGGTISHLRAYDPNLVRDIQQVQLIDAAEALREDERLRAGHESLTHRLGRMFSYFRFGRPGLAPKPLAMSQSRVIVSNLENHVTLGYDGFDSERGWHIFRQGVWSLTYPSKLVAHRVVWERALVAVDPETGHQFEIKRYPSKQADNVLIHRAYPLLTDYHFLWNVSPPAGEQEPDPAEIEEAIGSVFDAKHQLENASRSYRQAVEKAWKKSNDQPKGKPDLRPYQELPDALRKKLFVSTAFNSGHTAIVNALHAFNVATAEVERRIAVHQFTLAWGNRVGANNPGSISLHQWDNYQDRFEDASARARAIASDLGDEIPHVFPEDELHNVYSQADDVVDVLHRRNPETGSWEDVYDVWHRYHSPANKKYVITRRVMRIVAGADGIQRLVEPAQFFRYDQNGYESMSKTQNRIKTKEPLQLFISPQFGKLSFLIRSAKMLCLALAALVATALAQETPRAVPSPNPFYAVDAFYKSDLPKRIEAVGQAWDKTISKEASLIPEDLPEGTRNHLAKLMLQFSDWNKSNSALLKPLKEMHTLIAESEKLEKEAAAEMGPNGVIHVGNPSPFSVDQLRSKYDDLSSAKTRLHLAIENALPAVPSDGVGMWVVQQNENRLCVYFQPVHVDGGVHVFIIIQKGRGFGWHYSATQSAYHFRLVQGKTWRLVHSLKKEVHYNRHGQQNEESVRDEDFSAMVMAARSVPIGTSDRRNLTPPSGSDQDNPSVERSGDRGPDAEMFLPFSSSEGADLDGMKGFLAAGMPEYFPLVDVVALFLLFGLSAQYGTMFYLRKREKKSLIFAPGWDAKLKQLNELIDTGLKDEDSQAQFGGLLNGLLYLLDQQKQLKLSDAPEQYSITIIHFRRLINAMNSDFAMAVNYHPLLLKIFQHYPQSVADVAVRVMSIRQTLSNHQIPSQDDVLAVKTLGNSSHIAEISRQLFGLGNDAYAIHLLGHIVSENRWKFATQKALALLDSDRRAAIKTRKWRQIPPLSLQASA